MTDKEIIKEFEKIAYPIVHSNTFPEKDDVCLERLEKFILWKIRQVREEGIQRGRKEGFKAGQEAERKRIFGSKTEKEARDSFEDYVRADGKRRLVGKIKKMKLENKTMYPEKTGYQWRNGFNQAIEEILTS